MVYPLKVPTRNAAAPSSLEPAAQPPRDETGIQYQQWLSLAEGQRLAHVGSRAFDSDGFDYWSPELFRMHGLDPADKGLTVQETLDCVHPQHREAMANLIQGILAKPSAFDTTKRIVRPRKLIPGRGKRCFISTNRICGNDA